MPYFSFFNWASDKTAELLDMGQSEVLDKLINYLELGASKETKKLQLSLNSGHCHGLSICHAAMGAIGKTKWWEAALTEVATWDGKKESLDKLILLPDADDNKPIPLRMIFSKVLNYLKSCHVDNSSKDLDESKVVTLLDQPKLLMLMGIHQPDAFQNVIKYIFTNGRKHPDLVRKLGVVLGSNLDDSNLVTLFSQKKSLKQGDHAPEAQKPRLIVMPNK